MGNQREPVSGPGLLLPLNRHGGTALHEQLEQILREHVRSGRLAPGARLPSTRALSSELGVSRGVVLEAYAQLIAEGYLTATQGAPTRVALTPSIERPPLAATSLEPRYAYHFHPGLPDLASFPRDSWLRSIRAVLRAAPFEALGRADPRGTPELRNELMAYLGRARGAAPEPEHTIICAGFSQAFPVLCRTLRGRGLERIAIEDPGWAQHRLIAEGAGLMPIGIAVDEHGICVESLREAECEAVVVTPAHQFPTGAVLSSERRSALLEWADDRDGLIVEDDYDSELRYDRDPVGALQGLAPERVAYVGSVSKRLAPGLRIGWTLSPSWLTGALTYEKGVGDGGSPVLEQLALADYIARGELDRHLRRMRLRYRARREALIRALEREIPRARATGVAAGLFVAIALGPGVETETIVARAAALGVGVEGFPAGLVLGFGNVSEQAIGQGVEVLAEAVAAVAI